MVGVRIANAAIELPGQFFPGDRSKRVYEKVMLRWSKVRSRSDYRMAISTNSTFWEMYRELPVRTTIATVVPLFLGIAQLLNGYVHDIPVVRILGFTAGMIIAAVLVTQLHLVQFRKGKLQHDLFEEE